MAAPLFADISSWQPASIDWHAYVEWAYQWGLRAMVLYSRTPNLYASDSYVRARLQDSRLANLFSLTDAKWDFTPNERPPCPPPWKEYLAVQYTDRATVPGIGGRVDADIFLGREATPAIPTQPAEFTTEDINIWQMEDKLIPYNTGIARAWLAHRKAGREMGPPLDHEYGDRIEAHQRFSGASVTWEHTTHTSVWRDSRGKI